MDSSDSESERSQANPTSLVRGRSNSLSSEDSDLILKPRAAPPSVAAGAQAKESSKPAGDEEESCCSDDEEEEDEENTGSDDEDEDDDDDDSELSELSDEEEEVDESKKVPVTVTLVSGTQVVFTVDPNRTTVRRLTKMAFAAPQAAGYSKKRQRMWLTQGGANSTRPLLKRKKLVDYGIGANSRVIMQYNYQKTACTKCCQCFGIGLLVVGFVLTCGLCCWGCGCLRSYACRRRCRNMCCC